MVAAYLGFDTIVDLQRFVIMWPCLEAIRLICALPGESSDSPVFPSTIEANQALEFNTRVRLANEYTQYCWVRLVLIILRHNIAVYETNTSQENRARTILAIHNLPPRFWIPDHILEEEEEESPVYPILFPTVRFAEPEMMPLHRCLCLLHYLELSYGSLTIREMYLDARVECREDDLEVTEEDVPWWMR